MKETIFLNGKFFTPDEAKVSVSSPGLLRGYGLFETMRAYQEKIVYFNQHLERIKDSCKLIGMQFPYSLDKLKKIIREAVKISALKDAYLRLTLWQAAARTDVLLVVKEYRPLSATKIGRAHV